MHAAVCPPPPCAASVHHDDNGQHHDGCLHYTNPDQHPGACWAWVTRPAVWTALLKPRSPQHRPEKSQHNCRTAGSHGCVSCLVCMCLCCIQVGTLVPVDPKAMFMSVVQLVLAPVIVGTTLNQCFPRVGARRNLALQLSVLGRQHTSLYVVSKASLVSH